MKKRIIALILATILCASTVACSNNNGGNTTSESSQTTTNNKDDKSEDKSDDEANEKQADSQKDSSDGRVVGPDSKWDGTCPYGDLNIRCGMTINDILAQGDYAVYTESSIPDDISLVTEAPEKMCIPPVIAFDESIKNDILRSNFLKVMKRDGESFSTITEQIWYYNPYPYAVPLGECVVGSVLYDDLKGLTEDWDLDNDGKKSIDETKEIMGIEPLYVSDECILYPFDNFYVQFLADEKGNIYHMDEWMYGMTNAYLEQLGVYESEYGVPYHEQTIEDLDTSVTSFEVTMALGTYTVDLSYFATVDKITRYYVAESDYTLKLYIEGTSINGDIVKAEFENAYASNYVPIADNYGNNSTYYAKEEFTSDGKPVYTNYAYNGITQLKNRTIVLSVITNADGTDGVYQVEQDLDGVLIEK